MAKTNRCACGCGEEIPEGRKYASSSHAAAHGRAIARERRAAGLPHRKTEERLAARAGKIVKGSYTAKPPAAPPAKPAKDDPGKARPAARKPPEPTPETSRRDRALDVLGRITGVGIIR